VADAARRLDALSGNQSPLLGALALAAQQTHVGDSAVMRMFQPLAQVAPTKSGDKLITDANKAYVASLAGLGNQLKQLDGAQPADKAPIAQQVQTSAIDATSTVQTLAQTFNPDREAHLDGAVQALLIAPITGAQSATKVMTGSGPVNQMGGSFCSNVRPILNKSPLAANGPPAKVDELSAFLKPASGTLSAFTDQLVQQGLLMKQGSQLAAAPGTTMLSSAFVDFLNRATAFGQAIYPEGSPTPQISFALRPQTPGGAKSITFTLDRESVVATPNANVTTSNITWSAPADGGRADVLAQYGAQSVQLATYKGPWAVLQLLQDGRWQPSGDDAYHVDWSFPGPTGTPVQVSADVLRLSVPAAVLRKGYVPISGCNGPIAR
jgi:type VI secretion system protein ImpL